MMMLRVTICAMVMYTANANFWDFLCCGGSAMANPMKDGTGPEPREPQPIELNEEDVVLVLEPKALNRNSKRRNREEFLHDTTALRVSNGRITQAQSLWSRAQRAKPVQESSGSSSSDRLPQMQDTDSMSSQSVEAPDKPQPRHVLETMVPIQCPPTCNVGGCTGDKCVAPEKEKIHCHFEGAEGRSMRKICQKCFRAKNTYALSPSSSSASAKGNLCCICLVEPVDNESEGIPAWSCSHRANKDFCVGCVGDLLTKKQGCPLCRCEVTLDFKKNNEHFSIRPQYGRGMVPSHLRHYEHDNDEAYIITSTTRSNSPLSESSLSSESSASAQSPLPGSIEDSDD